MESNTTVRDTPFMASTGKEVTSTSFTSTNNGKSSVNGGKENPRWPFRRLNPGVILPLLAGVLFLFLWELQVFHKLLELKKYQLPLPSAIAEAMRDNFSLLLSYTGYTLAEAVVGMLIGSACGFLIALAATAWPRWGGGSLTLVAALNAVPIVALAPIMNLWFGDGIGSRAAIVAGGT
ncbi:hypothetical protein, partial [Paenibacillus riograndensis]|uniref:ABC transporter permease n=1 Tax=Paenibacillus riograndensis TaxID=483937 RepID=UPI003D155852